MWKQTLKLPSSTFPARPNPKFQRQFLRQCTDDFYAWQSSHRPAGEPFILHDGPPYANGPLHIGHAINKILKDTILRFQVQQGRRVVYRPSWDCHGLPIEMKALGSTTAGSLSPVKVRAQAWRLASKTIKDQMHGFKSFGVMADWDNKWTTMDKEYETRQLRVFQKLVHRGLIYRKHKPVYWSISSRTALAEAELEYKEDHESTAAYIRFPIVAGLESLPELASFPGPVYAAIWTTTPWTLPANKAIAVHEDMEYSVLDIDGCALIVATARLDTVREFIPSAAILVESLNGGRLVGLKYQNKLRGQASPSQPIVHADFVTADSGTGLVHVAPGHGQDDYELCSRLGIEAFAPITDDGHFTKDAFPDDPDKLTSAPPILEGGSQAVLNLVQEDVVATHTFHHKYPYDWRTKQPVVIRATAQWFADVGSIKGDALAALKNVRFVPETGRTRLENFVKGRSEWCISRQRSWGVPIPALYDSDGNAVMTERTIDHIISVIQQRGIDAWFSDAPDDSAWLPPSLSGDSYRRGTDTMDVWFDSGSSWTEINQPVDVYLEGSDQHRGWFQSSLLTYVASQKSDEDRMRPIAAPFRTLITHGFTLDTQGKKMSKSLGNTVAPEEVMDGSLLPPLKAKGGAGERKDALGPDILRLWAASSDFTSDILIGKSVLQPVHSALIKYRTICKMLIGSLHPSSMQAPLTRFDQMAMLQLSDTMEQVAEAFTNFEFHRGTSLLNHWVSAELSAFYLEGLKDRLYCGDGGGAVVPIFMGFLRMLAPVTPVLVEEAWSHRPAWMVEDSSFENPSRQLYMSPLLDTTRLTEDPSSLRRDMAVILPVRTAIHAALESAREGKVLGSSLQCSVIVQADDAATTQILQNNLDELETIFVVSAVDINAPVPSDAAWSYVKECNINGSRVTVHILPPRDQKCPRCWRYVAKEENSLCGRCEAVVANLPNVKE